MRLGFDGYRGVQQAARDVAMHVAAEPSRRWTRFELLTDGSELPVFAFASPTASTTTRCSTCRERAARDRGWLVPAYTFPENRQDLAALRIVVRNGFDRDLADLLVADLHRHIEYFDKLTSPLPDAAGASFSH